VEPGRAETKNKEISQILFGGRLFAETQRLSLADRAAKILRTVLDKRRGASIARGAMMVGTWEFLVGAQKS
jgi:hypothetical protein